MPPEPILCDSFTKPVRGNEGDEGRASSHIITGATDIPPFPAPSPSPSSALLSACRDCPPPAALVLEACSSPMLPVNFSLSVPPQLRSFALTPMLPLASPRSPLPAPRCYYSCFFLKHKHRAAIIAGIVTTTMLLVQALTLLFHLPFPFSLRRRLVLLLLLLLSLLLQYIATTAT